MTLTFFFFLRLSIYAGRMKICTRAPRSLCFMHCWLRLNDQPPKAKPGSGKKPASAPFGASKHTKAKKNPLFQADSKNFGIGKTRPHLLFSFLTPFLTFLYFLGQDIRPKTDLTRFVKWPEYVRLQRQKVILHQRLKVPPAIAQSSHTLDKNTATQLFKLLNKYRPESTQEKKARLQTVAVAAVADKDTKVCLCWFCSSHHLLFLL